MNWSSEVVFICNAYHPLGIEKLKGANMQVVEVANDEELLSWLDERQIDIFVNDLLEHSAIICASRQGARRTICEL